MESSIDINEIFVDLPPCVNKTNADECEHFTIRGYAFEMRKKDWRRCCPFPVNESEQQSPLPPLEVPKFKRWNCENCRLKAVAAKDIDEIKEAAITDEVMKDANSETREAVITDEVMKDGHYHEVACPSNEVVVVQGGTTSKKRGCPCNKRKSRAVEKRELVDNNLQMDVNDVQTSHQSEYRRHSLWPFQEGTSRAPNNVGEGNESDSLQDLNIPPTCIEENTGSTNKDMIIG